MGLLTVLLTRLTRVGSHSLKESNWRMPGHSVQFSSVQFSCSVSVWLFATPWIAAHQASLSIINSWSSLKLMSIESVMPSSHLILCRPLSSYPQSLPASESFPMSQLFAWGGQSIGVSALASFLPNKSEGWSPSEWTDWIWYTVTSLLLRQYTDTIFA